MDWRGWSGDGIGAGDLTDETVESEMERLSLKIR